MRFEPAESSETPSWGLPRAVVVLIGLAAAVIAVAGIKAFSSVIGPAFLALMLTVAIHPLHKWLHRKGVPAWVCVVATLSVVFGILLGLVAALVLSIARFATILPAYQEKFDDLVQQARQLLEARGVGSGEVEKALNIDANRVFSIVTAILDSTLGVFSGVLFIVALLLFMATDAITYERRLEILQRMRPDIASALTTFSVGIKKYILVSTVFGLIVAALDAGALWLIGIPLPILWGLLSFITNYIPNIGFILGLIPPALLGLLQGGPGTLLLVIVVYGVLNFVVQTVIQPKFVGETADISVTVTMLALVFWGWVLGPLGALLAIPLTLLTKAVFVDIDPATRWIDALITSKVVDPDEQPANRAKPQQAPAG
jgi:predicted PurR-regulated permease PerM